MLVINAKVNGQILKKEKEIITAEKSKGYIKVLFEFETNDWNDCLKTAFFQNPKNYKVYKVVLDSKDECEVPEEALTYHGDVYFAVAGEKTDYRITSTAEKFKNTKTIYGGEPSNPPEPDIYDQIVQLFEETKKQAEAATQSAEEAVQGLEKKVDKAQGTGNANKVMATDSDGNVQAVEMERVPKAQPTDSGKILQVSKDGTSQWSDVIPNQVKKNKEEIENARTGYMGTEYPTLSERIDGDINSVLDKVNVMAYKDTSIHAENTYARNMTSNRNKIEILGTTIQNCLDASNADKFSILDGTIDIEGYIEVTGKSSFLSVRSLKTSAVVKPDTKYTLVLEVKSNTLIGDGIFLTFASNSNNSNTLSNESIAVSKEVGISKYTFNTIRDFSLATSSFAFVLSDKATSGSIKFRYAIIEGDWTNKEVSFVPFGLNTPESTEVKMIGKNFFNLSELPVTKDGVTISVDGKGNIIANGKPNIEKDFIQFIFFTDVLFKNGTKLSSSIKEAKDGIGISFYTIPQYSDLNITMSEFLNSKTKVLTKDLSFKNLFINIRYDVGELVNYIINPQLEIGESPTDYTPYTENTAQINTPLGSVSDTVKDRFYVENGKAYVERKTKEIVFDGSDDEQWKFEAVFDNVYRFVITIPDLRPNNITIKCNLFVNKEGYSLDEEHAYCLDKTLFIFINKNRLTNGTADAFKTWLKTHIVEVRYLLATPITEEISVSDFYSYAEQTNWFTTNTIKPVFDVEIPSDLPAITQNLMTENADLKQKNSELEQKITEQQENNQKIASYILNMR